MLFFQKVQLSELPLRDDPLFVGHFFNLKGMWWQSRKRKQEMIFSVAITWLRAVKRQLWAPGFIEDELFLTRLTKDVREARKIIEFFFDIHRLGFNLQDGVNYGPTIVAPKKLPQEYIDSIEKHLDKIFFDPGPAPKAKYLVESNVSVRLDRQDAVKARLRQDREDLLPAVTWLYEQSQPITFYYRPAGRLQARDTSVWPIRAIETWPGWLRSELFGTSIDIENAFSQFLLEHLEKKHSANRRRLELLYPDLLRSAYDKQAFREELCRDVLRLPVHDENIKVVKSLLMALSNGSNVTTGLLASDSRSQAVQIVKRVSPNLSAMETEKAGKALNRIARQFRAAKREVCFVMGMKPTRENVKKIFEKYFHWEKVSRYKIWNVVGKTGLHLHDGLDGVITDLEADELVKLISEKTNLRVSVDA